MVAMIYAIGDYGKDSPSAMDTTLSTNVTPEGVVRFPPNVVTAEGVATPIGTARGGIAYIDQNVGGEVSSRPDVTAGPTGGIAPRRARGGLNGSAIAAQPSVGQVDVGSVGASRRNLRARATADTDVASTGSVIAAFLGRR